VVVADSDRETDDDSVVPGSLGMSSDDNEFLRLKIEPTIVLPSFPLPLLDISLPLRLLVLLLTLLSLLLVETALECLGK
jgi:hypothetical protein